MMEMEEYQKVIEMFNWVLLVNFFFFYVKVYCDLVVDEINKNFNSKKV